MLENLQCTFHGIYTTCTELETNVAVKSAGRAEAAVRRTNGNEGIPPNTDRSEGIFRPEKLPHSSTGRPLFRTLS